MDHLYNNIGTIAGSLLIAYVLFRSRTSGILREEVDALRTKCTRIETDNEDLKKAGHEKDVMIADLRAKTDLEAVKTQVAALQQQLLQEGAETRLTIVGMIQSVSKDIMTGFARHLEADKEFQQKVSDNFALTSSILDDLQRRQAAVSAR